MKFAKWVFLAAGVYGILLLAPMYFTEAKTGRDYPPAITHPEYYYGFIGCALAWLVMFIFLSRDPARYRALMIPCVLEKLAFGVPAVLLYAQGRIPLPPFAGGVIDLVLGALFVAAYRATGGNSQT